MKSDHAAMLKSKESKSASGKQPTGSNTTKKDKVTFSDSTANATEKVKAKAGRGLANEGTVVSYEEQR